MNQGDVNNVNKVQIRYKLAHAESVKRFFIVDRIIVLLKANDDMLQRKTEGGSAGEIPCDFLRCSKQCWLLIRWP